MRLAANEYLSRLARIDDSFVPARHSGREVGLTGANTGSAHGRPS